MQQLGNELTKTDETPPPSPQDAVLSAPAGSLGLGPARGLGPKGSGAGSQSGTGVSLLPRIPVNVWLGKDPKSLMGLPNRPFGADNRLRDMLHFCS